jgi:predicted nucleotidyltransferase
VSDRENGSVDCMAMKKYAFDADKVIDVCRKHAITSIGVFGSMARGESTPKSDIDLLVEFGERQSLFDVIGVEQELESALGRKVDLLTKNAVSPYLRERILGEVQMIYEKG